MAKDKFLSFIGGTEFEETLKNLIKNRDRETWNILSTSRFFKRLTSYQKTWIESVLKPVQFDRGETLIHPGQTYDRMYIIRKGVVEVFNEGHVVGVLKQGDFIGNLHEINRDLPAKYTYKAKGNILLFAINRTDMVSFAEKNPGLIIKLSQEM